MKSQIDSADAALAGGGMSPADTVECERRLQKRPGDIEARARLVGRLSMERMFSAQSSAAYLEHVRWFVENRPRDELLRSGFVIFAPGMDDKGAPIIERLWRRHLKRWPDDLEILDAVAMFYRFRRSNRGLPLLRRAMRLDPLNVRWPKEIAHLYRLDALVGRRGTKSAASNALNYFSRALAMTQSHRDRFYLLSDLAEMAEIAGQSEAATEYAQQLLLDAERYPTDWNFGNAIYRGNEVLGLVALRKRKVELAEKHLLAASRSNGSPQLGSFGPSFRLAKALAKQGHWSQLGRFLQNVAKFWTMGQGALVKWRADVAKRRVPDFNAAFKYRSDLGKGR
ncbi:MAG: hypothetical protein K1X89_06650 [Myxococcaceae bacterium]|nr:hypothetical protein [Myxococcaceae bacterium]